MKLTGEVLSRFYDSEDNMKIYAPKGTVDTDEYTGEETRYPHVFTAERSRYEVLEARGLVSKGKLVEQKKKSKLDKEEE